VDYNHDVEDDDEANEQPRGRRICRREDMIVRVGTGTNKTSLEREMEIRLLKTQIVKLQDCQEHFQLRKAITQQLCDL
jgi:hypothetical protein